MRLDSFISKYTKYSRRAAKQLILDEKVNVNGLTITEVVQVSEVKDIVKVNNKLIDTKNHELRYYVLNKPLNVLCTTKDERGRTTVLDIVKSDLPVYPVGRLDYNSTGLIFLTNDGDFAYKLTHPKFEINKFYLVECLEKVSNAQLVRLSGGINLYGKVTSTSEVKRVDDRTFEIELHEGMKRQIREMCKAVGLTVKSLHRFMIGGLRFDDVNLGEFRELTAEELSKLKQMAG